MESAGTGRDAVSTAGSEPADDRPTGPDQELRPRLRRPGMPREVLRRHRLDELMGSHLDLCPVLAVTAAPGTGKTVQAQLYAETTGMAVSWLTLDSAHRSARRLLSSLMDTLREHRRSDAASADRAGLRFDGTVEEAAALCAGSLLDRAALLIIDECEHLDGSPEAQSALETFLEYCPDALQILLLSRTDPAGPLQHRLLDGRIRLLGNASLRLTPAEAHDLAILLDSPTAADRVHEATGGWTAGAAFSFRYGLPEESPPNDLPSVIMNDVLAQLPEQEQQFLLACSVPDVLTRETATAVYGPEAHALWDAVRAKHLPATTLTDTTIVYHSLFRSFLHRRLLATDAHWHAELTRRYAGFLRSHHHPEEATELYLEIEEHDLAFVTAELAVTILCDRSDWETFLRWADQLGPERIAASPRLTAATVRALFGRRRFAETVDLVRDLDRRGVLREAMEADPALLATAAWALQADPAEARRFLDRYDGDYRADAVRFMLEVCTELTPVTPPLGTDWGDVERIVTWGLVLQGRIAELRSFIPDHPQAAIANPNVILSSVFAGDLTRARVLWNRVPREIRERPQSHFIEGLLLLSEGEVEFALSALQVALTDSRRTSFFLTPAYEILTGYIMLHLGRKDDAIAVLRRSVASTATAGQTALLEWAQAFLGLALLIDGRPETARPILGECVRSMGRAHRRLFLPSAAAYLSEAEARCGDPVAAHAAAELAYHTASMIGSYSALLPALRTFPDIARRENEIDPTGMRWRRLVVAPSARPPRRPSTEGGVRIGLQPFGPDRDILVDGERQQIGRMKIIELLALLVLNPDGIDRNRLQNALFPEATLRNGGNHFRQIAFKFRQLTGLSLDRRDGNLVGLPVGTIVEAADIQFEELLQTASWVPGEDRVDRLGEALGLVKGAYLGGSDLPWAEERRNHLDVVQEEARLEVVRLLLELGRPEAARNECEVLLALNRYSDPGYRLLVQIERTIGSESSVLAAYRRAVLALEELDLSPGDARRLLQAQPASPRRQIPPTRGRPADNGSRNGEVTTLKG